MWYFSADLLLNKKKMELSMLSESPVNKNCYNVLKQCYKFKILFRKSSFDFQD